MLLLLEGDLPFDESPGTGCRAEFSFWLLWVADLSLLAEGIINLLVEDFIVELNYYAVVQHFVLLQE